MSLKLFFADQIPVETTLSHLREHRARHAAMLERYRQQETELETRFGESPRLPYWLAVLRGGIRYAEMVVRWCDDHLDVVEGLAPSDYPTDPS